MHYACVHVFITILLIISLTKGEDLFSCYKVGAIEGAITAQDQGVLGVTSHLSREMPPTTYTPSLSSFSKGSPTQTGSPPEASGPTNNGPCHEAVRDEDGLARVPKL